MRVPKDHIYLEHREDPARAKLWKGWMLVKKSWKITIEPSKGDASLLG